MLMGPHPTRMRRKAQLLLTITASLIILILLFRDHISHSSCHPLSPHPLHHPTLPPQTTCRDLPGAADVFIALKTTATDAQAQLPIHLETTLQCARHFAIYSDLADTLATPADGDDDAAGSGIPIHDALDGIPAAVQDSAPEFELYHTLRAWQAVGANVTQLAGGLDGAWLRTQAWGLDKWKALPMLRQSLASAPASVKWFVYMEASTHLVWSNLLLWLRGFDAERRWYIGAPAYVEGAGPFANGGAGFIVSRKALEALVVEVEARSEEWVEATRRAWAGDFVVAQALARVGVGLTAAWPILQPEAPATLDYTETHWCYPVVSYHGVAPGWARQMWGFERAWMAVSLFLLLLLDRFGSEMLWCGG